MNRMSKVVAALGLALGLAAVSASSAHAVYLSTDSLTVTITPNAYYAVEVSTDDPSLNLGYVDLSASTKTVVPSTITIRSSYAATELKLQGKITGAWSFDPDTATQEQNNLAAWAVFTDTGVSIAPTLGTQGAFSGTTPGGDDSDVIDATAQDVGDVTAGVQRRFVMANPGQAGHKLMENLPTYAANPGSSQSHLWLNFRMPPSTTSSDPQYISITLIAGAHN